MTTRTGYVGIPRWLVVTGVAAIITLAAACDAGGGDEGGELPPAVAFDTAAVRIETMEGDTFHLTVELAESQEQWSHGLMERRSMPEDHGMLFVYPEERPGDAAFYMFRTRIPLDIAFMDEDGRIVAIRQMEPCETTYARACRRYSPGEPYWTALEVNRGYFDERGIGVGDRVVLIANEGDTP